MLVSNWKNLTPFPALENMKKGNKLMKNQLEEHLNKLDNFVDSIKDKNIIDEDLYKKYITQYEKFIEKMMEKDDDYLRNTLLRETPKALTTSHSLETLNDTHVSCVGRSKNVKDVSN